MEGRIRHLQALLEQAEIVEDDAGGGEVAGRVGGRRSATRATTTSSATCSARSRSATTTSTSSRPARRSAQALIGAKPGDTVAFEAPTGATLQVEVVAVE